MVDPQRLIAFCAMSLALSAVPGPSVMFVVGRALAHGRRVALASVLGNAIGGYVLVVAVAFGVGAVVARSVFLFETLKLAGAGVLVYLGVRALWRSRRAGHVVVAQPAPVPGGLRQVCAGFTVGVSNPKSIVFLMAVLPQFVDPASGGVVLQMLVLGLAGALLQMLSDGVWAACAAAARTWFVRSPRRAALVGGVGGLSMIGLGIGVAVTGRLDR